jgi:hypothetical protein
MIRPNEIIPFYLLVMLLYGFLMFLLWSIADDERWFYTIPIWPLGLLIITIHCIQMSLPILWRKR